MVNQKPKILVFMLSRTGCIPYATSMVNSIHGFEKYIFVSRYSPEWLPKDNHKIRTYRNALEFVFSSFFYLPGLFLKIISIWKSGEPLVAYFPVFHHWNPALIQLCNFLRIGVVFTVHDGLLHMGEQRNWEQKLLNFCIRKSHKLVFLSQYVLDLTKEHIGFKAKTCIIPHPVLKLSAHPVKERILPASPTLLFLGRVVEYKGVDLLVEAVSDLPKGILGGLTIAGRDFNVIQPQKMEGNTAVTRINRWLDDSEITALLDSHDILVLPYRQASQSGIITLGIAAAIPMICTNVGGLPEQLTPQEALFVEPDIKSIRQGILDLINKPDLYRKLHEKLLVKKQEEEEKYGKILSEFLID